MNKKFLVVCIFVFSFFLMTISGVARYSNLIDVPDFLSGSEEEKLNEIINDVRNEENVDLVILFINSLEGKTVEVYADDYYDLNGYLPDGALLLISKEDRAFQISTSGRMINVLHDQALEAVVDEMLPDLKSGDFYRAARTFLISSDYFLNPDSKSVVPKTFRITFAEVGYSMFFASIGALAILLGMRQGHKSVKAQRTASQYYKTNSLHFSKAYDRFLYSHISRTEKNTKEDDEEREDDSLIGRLRNRSFTSSSSSRHTSSSGGSHGGRGGSF